MGRQAAGLMAFAVVAFVQASELSVQEPHHFTSSLQICIDGATEATVRPKRRAPNEGPGCKRLPCPIATERRPLILTPRFLPRLPRTPLRRT